MRLSWIDGLIPIYRPARLPIVLSAGEVLAILSHLEGVKRLVASMLYGSGLRLMEALSLRVKDLDFDRRVLTVRGGKGEKDRCTVFPASLHESVQRHLERVRKLHRRDLASGGGSVALPGAFARKSSGAAREWGWQWVFPATSRYVDGATGERRRHPLHETAMQRSMKEAVL
jgi:integrase